MGRPEFQLGVDAAVVLKYGGVDQAVIKGLNKLGLPELMRETISISEFRRDFDVEFTTAGKFGRITFGGNMVLGDTKGQDQLKQYLIDNAKFADCRVYLDKQHFVTVDLANDEDAVFQVVKVSPQEADKNGVFGLQSEFVCGGRIAYFTKHLTADTIALVAGGSGEKSTITDSDSGFVTAGFEAGQTLIIEGSAADDGQYLIDTVEAGTITLTGIQVLTGEAAGSSITLHGGRL